MAAPATAGACAHGAVAGAVLPNEAQLLDAEQASMERYLEARQARVHALRLATAGVA